MSRIGKKPVHIPEGVEVSVKGESVEVKGPKGSLSLRLAQGVSLSVSDDKKEVSLSVKDPEMMSALWGTMTRLVENMIHGVVEGFQKQLELQGVGYRMSVSGKKIDLALGFSHPVSVDIPEGIDVKVENMILTISGIDKQQVGQFAAEVRSLRKVEPYKGKGFRYVGEVVRRKEGKKAGSTT